MATLTSSRAGLLAVVFAAFLAAGISTAAFASGTDTAFQGPAAWNDAFAAQDGTAVGDQEILLAQNRDRDRRRHVDNDRGGDRDRDGRVDHRRKNSNGGKDRVNNHRNDRRKGNNNKGNSHKGNNKGKKNNRHDNDRYDNDRRHDNDRPGHGNDRRPRPSPSHNRR
ncbi:MAG: hypothetical protein LBT40_12590 [Deltaproteobacteria bacterium]|jgi:hypothetical protein|nr:hypothetical protein [Deltaproteobacteria bacterium]